MSHPGGSLRARAGLAHGASQRGGEVELSAGAGLHPDSGSGGNIRISGGHAAGVFNRDGMNDGGDIQIVSGSASKGLSGSVLVQSGISESASSGEIGEAADSCSYHDSTKNITHHFAINFSDCHIECRRKWRDWIIDTENRYII